MAFIARVNETENQIHEEADLVFVEKMLQQIQDRFCRANHCYLVCINRNVGVITEAHGSAEENAFVHAVVKEDAYAVLLNKLISGGIENVIEEQQQKPYVKFCGVAIRQGDVVQAIWVVTAFIEDRIPEDVELPDEIMMTKEVDFYRSIELLETISKQLFQVKREEQLAREAFLKSKQAQERMELELKRSSVMTEILKMLDSDQSFPEITQKILTEVGAYMKLSWAALVQRNNKTEMLEEISHFWMGQVNPLKREIENRNVKDCPFFDGNTYVISEGAFVQDRIRKMQQEYGIRNAIFLPVEFGGKANMYFCAAVTEKRASWTMEEIKFLNDVKRVVQSILFRRITKNSLASSYSALEEILEQVGSGIYVCDPQNGKVLYTNQCYRKFLPENGEDSGLEGFLRKKTGTDKINYTEFYSDKDNRWFDIHNSKINWVDGREVTLSTIYEVTDKKIYQQKIERQANNDFLTGLYNRMRCEQDLEEYIRQINEIGGQGALLYLDLDDFKHINDGLGHRYGDLLLKEISESLKTISGIENSCYRVGGDEFMIIIAHHHYNMLGSILQEVQKMFTRPWLLKGTDYYCTMSMGVVRFPMDGSTVEELIKKADIALFEAKRGGKNRIEYYDMATDIFSHKRLDLEKNMRNATKNECNEFEVFFQPIVDAGRHCVGAEALVRWNSKELGFISPTEFIPLAEYLGLINPIGNYVLEQACACCTQWNHSGFPDFKVHVNLSVVQLLQNDIVDQIKTIVKESGICPDNLILEVTESLAVNDMGRMKRILNQIKALGARVALDDFGTGYSSLNHVREMPIDIVKIDCCFIKDIAKDEFQQAFVKLVAELAGTIGMEVCVEGVEVEEQFEIVTEMKINRVQGFYFDPPIPIETFEHKYLNKSKE